MKKSKVVLVAMVLSVIFSAIATELSMRHSITEAVSTAQEIELTDEELANLHVLYEPNNGNSNDQSESEKFSQEELKTYIEEIQQTTSAYHYPGYWDYWLQGFLKVFITTFLVALLQSFLVIKSIGKDNLINE